MTIPIQPVSIHPQLAPRQTTPWEELFLKAVQHGQELGLQRKKLLQDQQEFELRKKLMGPQAESLALDIEKKKRDLKAAQEDHDNQERAHTIYTGMLAQGRITPEEWSRELQNANDPGVHKWLTHYRDEAIKTATAQETLNNLQNPPWETRPSQGTYGQVNPRTGESRQTNLAMPPDAGERRIPVVTEREKASAAVSTIRANSTINRIELSDPNIGARVAKKAAARKSVIGGIMRRLVGTSQEDANLLAEAQIEQSMTPEELEFYVAGKQLLSGILPGLSGKQVTAREYVMHAPAYLSMGSTNPRVIQARAKARNTRIRSFVAEAGAAMAERLPELQDVDLSEYGLGGPPARKRRAENPY